MITNKPVPRDVGRPRSFADHDIFAATARAVTRFGYARLTVEAVAADVGCTGPALIRRFGSKRGLLLAYLDWSNAASRERFRQARAAHDSPLAALRARFQIPADERLDEVADPAGYANLVIFHLAAWSDPELRDGERVRRDIFADEISTSLEDARIAGELVDCDTRRLGRTLLTALVGAALMWASDEDRTVEDRLTEVLDEIVGPYLADPASL